jgi:hypothetical protein
MKRLRVSAWSLLLVFLVASVNTAVFAQTGATASLSGTGGDRLGPAACNHGAVQHEDDRARRVRRRNRRGECHRIADNRWGHGRRDRRGRRQRRIEVSGRHATVHDRQEHAGEHGETVGPGSIPYRPRDHRCG